MPWCEYGVATQTIQANQLIHQFILNIWLILYSNNVFNRELQLVGIVYHSTCNCSLTVGT